MATDEHQADVAADYRRLHEACGLVEAGSVDRLCLRGEDRLRFLGGLVTCDVKGLGPGQGARGFFTDIKGRLLADVVILAETDALWLDLPAAKGAEIEAHLLKYRIADRVEVESAGSVRRLSVVGPHAGATLGAEELSDAWAHGDAVVLGERVSVFRDTRFGILAFTLLGDAATVDRILNSSKTGAGEPRAADFRALEILRVEEGQPRFGIDIGGDNFPQETGLEAATVSYTKGCYLGQEIVARIHYRGGVNRRLVGLRFTADGDARGRKLTLDGRGIGTVTSCIRSPTHGSIGLAIVHNRADDGSDVDVEDSGKARLVALPFGR